METTYKDITLRIKLFLSILAQDMRGSFPSREDERLYLLKHYLIKIGKKDEWSISGLRNLGYDGRFFRDHWEGPYYAFTDYCSTEGSNVEGLLKILGYKMFCILDHHLDDLSYYLNKPKTYRTILDKTWRDIRDRLESGNMKKIDRILRVKPNSTFEEVAKLLNPPSDSD